MDVLLPRDTVRPLFFFIESVLIRYFILLLDKQWLVFLVEPILLRLMVLLLDLLVGKIRSIQILRLDCFSLILKLETWSCWLLFRLYMRRNQVFCLFIIQLDEALRLARSLVHYSLKIIPGLNFKKFSQNIVYFIKKPKLTDSNAKNNSVLCTTRLFFVLIHRVKILAHNLTKLILQI